MKAKILAALREAEGYVSGQELCERFGVSRTAVWKAINQLKKDGYEIEAVQNRGYRIVGAPDILSENELSSIRKTDWIGKKIYYYDETDSTNVRAWNPCGGRPAGCRKRKTWKRLEFPAGNRNLYDTDFKTGAESFQCIHADTGGSHGGGKEHYPLHRYGSKDKVAK